MANPPIPPALTPEDIQAEIDMQWHIAGMYGRTDIFPMVTDPVLKLLLHQFSLFTYENGTLQDARDETRSLKLEAWMKHIAGQIQDHFNSHELVSCRNEESP